MGQLEDLQTVIDAEHAEVSAKVATLVARIDDLIAQQGSGTLVTPEQFEALKVSIQGISEPLA